MRRIEGLASLVTKGAKVIDVGTDHAYLPVYLYTHDITHKVAGSDISSSVLKYSLQNLKKYHLDDKIPLYLSDGFLSIHDNFDEAVISGMGTDTIINILSIASLPQKLIICSHNNHYALRKFMQEKGYKIQKEIVIKDKKKYYDMIKYEKKEEHLSEYELLVGKHENLEYTNYLLNKYQKLYENSHNEKYLHFINVIEKTLAD